METAVRSSSLGLFRKRNEDVFRYCMNISRLFLKIKTILLFIFFTSVIYLFVDSDVLHNPNNLPPSGF